VHAQIELALAEADAVLFLADGRAGLNPQDHEVARRLRRTAKPVIYAVNKVDGPTQENAAHEFYALGVEKLHFISAAHGLGVAEILQELAAALSPAEEKQEDDENAPVRVALVGRPNVGKSSLVNALLGQTRVVVSDMPGTTRDAVDTPLHKNGRDYLLIDTAGIRRQGRVARGLEKAGVFRSLRALSRCHVAVAVIDAGEGVTDQDLHLVGEAAEANRGLALVLNKWDLLAGRPDLQKKVREQARKVNRFAPWTPVLTLSAQTRKGPAKLLPVVDQVWADYNKRLATGPLNQALEGILAHHQPPSAGGRRLKFYYASQVSTRPPMVVLFVNDPLAVHFSYKRYLLNELRQALGLTHSPLVLAFRARTGRRGGRGPGLTTHGQTVTFSFSSL
jgi:GTP-binding protein